MENFKAIVNEQILNLSVLHVEPQSDMSLRDDFGFDSLKLVELIVALENSLHIEFDESDLDPQKFSAVDDLYKIVLKYLSVNTVLN